jgi:NAD(P)-dependent dehydrogenase (short-subunit alcohol dehydrogenase family)
MSPGCAIVTDGSRGLGLGIGAALAETGRPVVIAACDPQDLRNAAAELEAKGADVLASRPDITDARAVRGLVRLWRSASPESTSSSNNAGGRSPEPAHGCRDTGKPKLGNR